VGSGGLGSGVGGATVGLGFGLVGVGDGFSVAVGDVVACGVVAGLGGDGVGADFGGSAVLGADAGGRIGE
jgi:hypothetical protein